MVSVLDLLYSPIRAAKGSDMDANEYAEKLEALDELETQLDRAVSQLNDAAAKLREGRWRDLPVSHRKPGLLGSGKPVPAAKVGKWPTLDEITALATRYWATFAEAETAWGNLSPALQKAMRAPGKPKY
jgi:hypothetical protein